MSPVSPASDPPMTGHIIAEPFTGLGNRLRCMASLMIIARRCGAVFHLSWLRTDECPAAFEDLFVADELLVPLNVARMGKGMARSRVRENRIATQDALVELILLSRTRIILGGNSSFSEVAAMMGNTTRVVLGA